MEFSESLKKNRDFRYVYQKGRSYANKYFIMYVLENHHDRNYLGISVSKKVGNSVVRHRICRLVRESYRLHENMFNSGLNIVVVARKNAFQVSYHETESALLHLSKLHHILKESWFIYDWFLFKWYRLQYKNVMKTGSKICKKIMVKKI